jgi:hypothetical protein
MGPTAQALAHNFSTMTLTSSSIDNWYIDSCASSHMVSNFDFLSHVHPPTSFTPPNIIIGNGSSLPITAIGSISFPLTDHSLHLHNILVSLHIIKNLISVCRFTTDNNCSIEFDPFGLSVKDLAMGNVIVRCNSSRELYSFRLSPHPHTFATITSTPVLWHRRLGHLGHESLSHLTSSLHWACNKSELETMCHPCQLGRQRAPSFCSIHFTCF